MRKAGVDLLHRGFEAIALLGRQAAEINRRRTRRLWRFAKGIQRLRDERTIDIVLMDLQYVPAILTEATRDAANRMVSAIAEVSREEDVNLFRRFELMKGWREVARISFEWLIPATTIGCMTATGPHSG